MIQAVTLAKLSISRVRLTKCMIHIPVPSGIAAYHTIPKLRRWSIANLLGMPPLEIAQSLQPPKDLKLRHQPVLERTYRWQSCGEGRIKGTPAAEEDKSDGVIMLRQANSGLHWLWDSSSLPTAKYQADQGVLEDVQLRSTWFFKRIQSFTGFLGRWTKQP
ncbi:hypothetical protein PI125_g11397 [Phytophthora idaei]|nr:hypothetical protein PI125_g11397 [Phytophthora idaei]